jgi:hypothetical protein
MAHVQQQDPDIFDDEVAMATQRQVMEVFCAEDIEDDRAFLLLPLLLLPYCCFPRTRGVARRLLIPSPPPKPRANAPAARTHTGTCACVSPRTHTDTCVSVFVVQHLVVVVVSLQSPTTSWRWTTCTSRAQFRASTLASAACSSLRASSCRRNRRTLPLPLFCA